MVNATLSIAREYNRSTRSRKSSSKSRAACRREASHYQLNRSKPHRALSRADSSKPPQDRREISAARL
ncbi:hypothetical protein KM043_011729 [Ampulex compressa]|nr:hypothetical protein KM043_011729 [Ampulex compressa]